MQMLHAAEKACLVSILAVPCVGVHGFLVIVLFVIAVCHDGSVKECSWSGGRLHLTYSVIVRSAGNFTWLIRFYNHCSMILVTTVVTFT